MRAVVILQCKKEETELVGIVRRFEVYEDEKKAHSGLYDDYFIPSSWPIPRQAA